jgi:hypothetical protein
MLDAFTTQGLLLAVPTLNQDMNVCAFTFKTLPICSHSESRNHMPGKISNNGRLIFSHLECFSKSRAEDEHVYGRHSAAQLGFNTMCMQLCHPCACIL